MKIKDFVFGTKKGVDTIHILLYTALKGVDTLHLLMYSALKRRGYMETINIIQITVF